MTEQLCDNCRDDIVQWGWNIECHVYLEIECWRKDEGAPSTESGSNVAGLRKSFFPSECIAPGNCFDLNKLPLITDEKERVKYGTFSFKATIVLMSELLRSRYNFSTILGKADRFT
ncbi:unnamed protein product [Dicrocoelium dendriticum]|nr:unnamed protein product [Dicrocoelium dendriticum]